MLKNSLCCSVLLLVAGCSADQHDHPELKSGQQLFEFHCAGCHQADGSGVFIKGVPANRDTDLSSLQIVHKLQSGSEKKTKMPVFEKMPQQEASKIARYLKQLGQQ